MRDPHQHKCIGKVVTYLLAISFLFVSSASATRAAPGDLDPTFGAGGKLTDWTGQARSVAIDPNGKIVAVGYTTSFPFDIAVARYNPDGSPDVTFGNAGKVSIPLLIVFTYVFGFDVAIQPDGKIVVTCFDDDQNFGAIIRLNNNGSLDTSFGNQGVVGTTGGYYSVTVQSDGKIITSAGVPFNNPFDYRIRRFNANGSIDITFGGGDGVTDLPIAADAVLTQADGKIIGAGESGNQFAVARFNPDGTADESFDSDGLVTTSTGTGSGARSVMTLRDGRIVAVGSHSLVRYNPNGSLDTTFDNDGIVALPVQFGWTRVAVQANGKVVIAGTSHGGSTDDYALIRYNPDGSLDLTFGGGDGIATVDFGNSIDSLSAMALDDEGRAVVAGTSSNGSVSKFALARLLLEPHQTLFDFDGDGRSDVSVFRPGDSVWYLSRSTQGFFATQFGLPTDKVVPADYDGDGITDIAVFRDGVWWLRKSSSGAVESIHFGAAGDIPVPADYTGDGRDELAVFRNGEWWALDLSNNQTSFLNFGLATDKPVPGDYDGDGRVDQAVYRNGEWHLNRSTLGYTVINFGLVGDRPVVGDYDGDGKSDIAVYRDGMWYVQQSTAGFRVFQWGIASDIPAPADYDGDGKSDAAVFRDGVWYQLHSTGEVSIQQFGLANDKPVPSAFVP